MDQEQYHDSNPYQDPYQYQSPPQEFTPVSNTLQEMFDEFMRKSEERSIEHKESQRQFAIQHQQYLEQWKQFEDQFGIKCQYTDDQMEKCAIQTPLTQSTEEHELVKDAVVFTSGEKIVLEDEETMIPAEEESQELTTMIVGDMVLEMED